MGRYQEEQLCLEEIHRFSNEIVSKNNHYYWDIKHIFSEIVLGIKKGISLYDVTSLGIDTWGVDYGLIDSEGKLVDMPRSYRDERTHDHYKNIEKYTTTNKLFTETGVKAMPINTLFQLLDDKEKYGDHLENMTILMIPDLLNFFLTGKIACERSIASTSQLQSPITRKWHSELLSMFGLPHTLFPRVVNEGNFLGSIKDELELNHLKVYNICQHDTASAVVSIPSTTDNFIFVSCGTWSLIGTELNEPILSEKAMNYGFSNESGISGSVRFLKNCTGLWIIQELKKNFEGNNLFYTYDDITKHAVESSSFVCMIDTDHSIFSQPGNMKEKINKYAHMTGQSLPATSGEYFRVVYEGLAFKYKSVISEIIDTTKINYEEIHIIGGGSQSSILCQMVSDVTNHQVYAGPKEATAIGNIITQLIAEGDFSTIKEARKWLKKSIEQDIYVPTNQRSIWEKQYIKYKNILKRAEQVEIIY